MRIGRHLCQPLLHLDSKIAEISPASAPQNKIERLFVEDLRAFHDGHPAFFHGKEFYLLRNPSNGRGVGFFESGNFDFDFIVWLLVCGQQHAIFVGPKGVRIVGPTDPENQLYEMIKEIEQRLGDPAIRLQPFVASNTPSRTMRMLWHMENGPTCKCSTSPFRKRTRTRTCGACWRQFAYEARCRRWHRG